MAALNNIDLGADCAKHARMFFNQPAYVFDSAVPGTFAIAPTENMVGSLQEDYEKTKAMIFGCAPAFEDILKAAARIEGILNGEDCDK